MVGILCKHWLVSGSSRKHWPNMHKLLCWSSSSSSSNGSVTSASTTLVVVGLTSPMGVAYVSTTTDGSLTTYISSWADSAAWTSSTWTGSTTSSTTCTSVGCSATTSQRMMLPTMLNWSAIRLHREPVGDGLLARSISLSISLTRALDVSLSVVLHVMVLSLPLVLTKRWKFFRNWTNYQKTQFQKKIVFLTGISIVSVIYVNEFNYRELQNFRYLCTKNVGIPDINCINIPRIMKFMV